MSAALIQGNFMGKVAAIALSTNKKEQVELKGEFEIVGGEHNGRRLPYSGLFTDRAIKYTRRAMLELGWDGKPLPTDPREASAALSSQVMKAGKTVPIEVQIATWKKDDGTVSEWSNVRNVGTYSAPIVPPSKSQIEDVNKWLSDAGKDDDSIPF